MASLFDTLQAGAQRAGIQARTKQSKNWFRKKVNELGDITPRKILKDDALDPSSKEIAGSMYMYFYDPKTKETLPYYDRFPLTIMVGPAPKGFYGLNLHYIPLDLRAKLLDSLLDTINNKKYNVGSIADISCFSLYPGKNLGAYGDAGIITTNSKIFFNRIRKLRNLGSEKKFKHEYVGVNSRLDSIQAIVLNEKIKFLDRNNLKRQKIAKYYNNNINNKKIKLLEYSKYCVYHQYLILTNYRAKLETYLKKKNIQYGFHYPNSLNQIQALKKIYKKQTYYNAEKIAKNSISLPIDPNLNKKKLDYIIKTLNNF